MLKTEERYMITATIEKPTGTIKPEARSARPGDVDRIKQEIKQELSEPGDTVLFEVTGPVWRKVKY